MIMSAWEYLCVPRVFWLTETRRGCWNPGTGAAVWVLGTISPREVQLTAELPLQP